MNEPTTPLTSIVQRDQQGNPLIDEKGELVTKVVPTDGLRLEIVGSSRKDNIADPDILYTLGFNEG